jgi:hypothetical protein
VKRPAQPTTRAKRRITGQDDPERRRLLQQAAEAMRRGSLAEAERASRLVLPRAPDDPDTLFHATAPLSFKPGYENRRINVTMLFGRRHG